ncbi:agenet domain-containing protein [Tanacetum coccineum]
MLISEASHSESPLMTSKSTTQREPLHDGKAIGHMVTYAKVTEMILDLQLNDDTINVIKDSMDTLDELETYGFDVGTMQDHLNRLLASRVKASELEENVKTFEKGLKKYNGEKLILEEKIRDFQEKL